MAGSREQKGPRVELMGDFLYESLRGAPKEIEDILKQVDQYYNAALVSLGELKKISEEKSQVKAAPKPGMIAAFQRLFSSLTKVERIDVQRRALLKSYSEIESQILSALRLGAANSELKFPKEDADQLNKTMEQLKEEIEKVIALLSSDPETIGQRGKLKDISTKITEEIIAKIPILKDPAAFKKLKQGSGGAG